MKLYLYSGAGNKFVVLDGRCGDVTPDAVVLCARYGTDGLMILRESARHDFAMEFFNPDGSGGMMCGNGGRCIVAFADFLGIKPSDGRIYRFEAPDGLHTGEILGINGDTKTIRLRMIDVREYYPVLDGWFVNTGTRHYVKFVPDVEDIDISVEGPRYRWDPAFSPVGANANFVKVEPGRLKVRTFEKGVEGETLACGTGLTASAVAAWLAGIRLSGGDFPSDTVVKYNLRAREDDLCVEFRPVEGGFDDVYLTGPALMYGSDIL